MRDETGGCVRSNSAINLLYVIIQWRFFFFFSAPPSARPLLSSGPGFSPPHPVFPAHSSPSPPPNSPRSPPPVRAISEHSSLTINADDRSLAGVDTALERQRDWLALDNGHSQSVWQ